MKKEMNLQPVGHVDKTNGFAIKLNKAFIPCLKNIDGFSHLQIVWWGNQVDTDEYRKVLISEKPYKKGPEQIGIFATRSQIRPNPILITTIAVIDIDYERGIIRTPYIDAEQDTPVLDIKPYHKSERVTQCQVPKWCNHWPDNYEETAHFNWEAEFNF